MAVAELYPTNTWNRPGRALLALQIDSLRRRRSTIMAQGNALLSKKTVGNDPRVRSRMKHLHRLYDELVSIEAEILALEIDLDELARETEPLAGRR